MASSEDTYRVLYYPEPDPSEKWLRAHLLLVDQIVRIVPDDPDYEDPDYIKELRDTFPGCIEDRKPDKRDFFISDDHFTSWITRLRRSH
jgi:hypothetical protein